MKRLISLLLLLTAAIQHTFPQTSPFSMRLDYMLKQIDDSNASAVSRISWADSVLKNQKSIADRDIVAGVLMKKAEIAYDAAFYRKALNAYLTWINDHASRADDRTRLKALDRTAELYYYIGWYELSVRLSFDIIRNKKEETLKYLDALSFQRMAHCYIRMRDMQHARKYTALADSCLKAISIPENEIRNKAEFDMNLLQAGISLINSDLRTTYDHLAEAKKFARGTRDSIAILGDEAIVYEAIGDINIARKCYESIIGLKDRSYQSIVCINNYVNFLNGQKDYAKAHQICALSYSMLDSMELDHSKSNLLELESDIYMHENDFRNAYEALRKSKEINDTIFKPERLSYIYGLNNVTDRHSLSALLVSETRRSGILRIAGIVLLVISVFAIFMWVLNSSRLKMVRSASESELAQLRSIIEQKDSAISGLNEQILHKDRAIETYAEAIGDEETALARFKNMYCRLVPKLADRHPDLTKAEINIAVYILLGVSTKDIATRQNLSVRTIENTKYRLYKKIGVAATDVPDYLRGFVQEGPIP